LDLYRCSMKDSVFKQDFQLKSNRAGVLTGIAGFFDVILNNPASEAQIKLETGPFNLPTHWKQCVFLLPAPVPVEEHQLITGNISCIPSGFNKRWLDVTIKLEEPKFRYTYTLC